MALRDRPGPSPAARFDKPAKGNEMQTREWMAECTESFLTTVQGLDDADWDAPSLLPGWRRREVVAHVHHNAEALQRLVTWARTGMETLMYASREQRDADIERSAKLPADELRRLVVASAATLDAELDTLTPEQWDAEVITARGRRVPASEIPWLRCREVAVHGVDLAAELRFDAFPEGFNDALVRDVVKLRLGRGEAATLAAWLTGRDVAGDVLGPWL